MMSSKDVYIVIKKKNLTVLLFVLCVTGCYSEQNVLVQETTQSNYTRITPLKIETTDTATVDATETLTSPTPTLESTLPTPTVRVSSILPTPNVIEKYEAGLLEGYLTYASYDGEKGDYELVTMNLANKTLHCLTCEYTAISSPQQPAWSPDGLSLAFTAFRKGDSVFNKRVWLMNVNGNHLVALTKGDSDASYPKWSPNGEFLSYSYGNINQTEICVVHVNNQESWCFAPNSKYDRYAAWSPDGQQIAFVSSNDLRKGSQLYTMQHDGTEIKLLSDISGRIGDLEWSPDGRHIAFTFVSPESESGKLYILDVETGELRRLTSSDMRLGEEYPSWSLDGQYIVFAHTAARTAQIVIIHVESGRWIELTPLGVPNDNTTPAWFPNPEATPKGEAKSKQLMK